MLDLLSPALSSIAMEAREKTLNCRVDKFATTPPCLLHALDEGWPNAVPVR